MHENAYLSPMHHCFSASGDHPFNEGAGFGSDLLAYATQERPRQLPPLATS